MRLAVDAMGGDHAPEPIIRGAIQALLADDELNLTLVGDQGRIEKMVDVPTDAGKRLLYDHTTEVVGMDENPAHAMRRKPNASIFRCGSRHQRWSAIPSASASSVFSTRNRSSGVSEVVVVMVSPCLSSRVESPRG